MRTNFVTKGTILAKINLFPVKNTAQQIHNVFQVIFMPQHYTGFSHYRRNKKILIGIDCLEYFRKTRETGTVTVTQSNRG